MANPRKQYRIILDEPPAQSVGRRAGSGLIQNHIARLGAEAPGQWTLFDANRKNIGYLWSLKQKTPGLEIRTQANANGTNKVWMKYTPPVVEAASSKKK